MYRVLHPYDGRGDFPKCGDYALWGEEIPAEKLSIGMFGIIFMSASVIDRSHPSNSGPTQVTWKIFLIYNKKCFPSETLASHIHLQLWLASDMTAICGKLLPPW